MKIYLRHNLTALVTAIALLSTSYADVITYTWTGANAQYLGQDDASYLLTVQLDSDASPINTFIDPDNQGNGYMPFSITLELFGGSQGYQLYTVPEANMPAVRLQLYDSDYNPGTTYSLHNLFVNMPRTTTGLPEFGDTGFTLGAQFTSGVLMGSAPFALPLPQSDEVTVSTVHFHLYSGTADDPATFAASSIPEPSTLALMLSASLIMLCKKRSRTIGCSLRRTTCVVPEP